MSLAPPRSYELTPDKPALAGFLLFPVTFATLIHIETTPGYGMNFLAKSTLPDGLASMHRSVTFKTIKIKPRVCGCACVRMRMRDATHSSCNDVTLSSIYGDMMYMQGLHNTFIP